MLINRNLRFRIASVLFFFLLIAFNQSCTEKEEKTLNQILDIQFKKEGEVKLYNQDSLLQTIDVEFAVTPNQRRQGLMHRSTLEDKQAMFFIHPDEEIGKLRYWMKNTRIPLDIIYIDKDSVVVSIAKNAQPYDETGVAASTSEAKYVLEIAAGLSEKWGIEEGETKISWFKSP